MSGTSYCTVEAGAHYGPFGDFVLNFVVLMLRGLLKGLNLGPA